MKRTTWFVLAVLALVFVAFVLAVPGTSIPAFAQAPALNVVQTDAGQIAPARDSTGQIQIFRGIPYAAPPVSDLRWKPPQPVTPWQGLRRAEMFAPICMAGTPQVPGSVFYAGVSGVSEDCLYLNVWTPAKTGTEKLPVLVGLTDSGAQGTVARSDPAALAKKGIVSVTFSYRQGVLGWLIHPELDQEPGSNNSSGNYHYLDAIAALKWVQKNIAAFGGDPANVTLWSSPSSSPYVGNLTASPVAKGLFQRTVSFGSISPFIAYSSAGIGVPVGHSAASQLWADWMKKNFNATTLAELRARSAWDLMKPALPYASGQAMDGYVVTDYIDAAFAKGQQNDLPLLVGWDKDFYSYMAPMASTVVSYTAAVQAQFGKSADQFLQLYPAKTDAEALAQSYAYGADSWGWGDWAWAKAHNQTGKTKAFVYYWTYAPPWKPEVKFTQANPATKLGAYLSAEIEYFFQNLDVFAAQRQYTDADTKLSDLASAYLVNFVKSGDPNGAGLPTWPAFDEKVDNSVLWIGAQTRAGSVPNKARLEFLETFYRSRVAGK